MPATLLGKKSYSRIQCAHPTPHPAVQNWCTPWTDPAMHTRSRTLCSHASKTVQLQQTTNLVWESGKDEEIMHNLRGSDESPEFDTHSFCFRVAPTHFKDWDSRRKVEEEYLPELEALIKREVDGVDEVQIFDWRVGNRSIFSRYR